MEEMGIISVWAWDRTWVSLPCTDHRCADWISWFSEWDDCLLDLIGLPFCLLCSDFVDRAISMPKWRGFVTPRNSLTRYLLCSSLYQRCIDARLVKQWVEKKTNCTNPMLLYTKWRVREKCCLKFFKPGTGKQLILKFFHYLIKWDVNKERPHFSKKRKSIICWARIWLLCLRAL